MPSGVVGLLLHASRGDDHATFLGRNDGQEAGDSDEYDRHNQQSDGVEDVFAGLFCCLVDDGSYDAVDDEHHCDKNKNIHVFVVLGFVGAKI